MENSTDKKTHGGEEQLDSSLVHREDELEIVLLHPDAKKPCYMTPGAAAADVSSCEEYTIEPGGRVKVDLGMAFKIPKGYYIEIVPRSSQLPKYGLISPVGKIDSDYTGRVFYPVANISNETVTIKKGERVAQVQYFKLGARPKAFDQLLLERDQNGFGGTGRI